MSAFLVICHTCKVKQLVRLSTSAYAADEFQRVHALCKTDMAALPTDIGEEYDDLDSMTDVGRALVFERLLSRLMNQVKFVQDVLQPE